MLKIAHAGRIYLRSISSHFGQIHSWNVRRSRNLQKITQTAYFWGL